MKGVVTTATVTFNSSTLTVASAPVGKSESKEAVEVTALDDTKKRYVPGAVKSEDEFTVTVYDQGANSFTVGTVGAMTITGTISDGSTTASTSASWDQVILTKIEFGSIEADGDRKATIDLTFQPNGNVPVPPGP